MNKERVRIEGNKEGESKDCREQNREKVEIIENKPPPPHQKKRKVEIMGNKERESKSREK